MEKNDIISKLQLIFNNVFKSKSIQIDNLTSAKDVEGWDSFTHLVLIQEVEKDFNIEFKLRELMRMENVGDMIEIIASKF
jgi:acyl carrier protein